MISSENLRIVTPAAFSRVSASRFLASYSATMSRLVSRAAPRHHLTAETGNAHLQSLEVVELVDLVAEPAAHLRAGVAGGIRDDAEVLEECVERVDAATVVHPGVLLARRKPERQRRAEA